MQAAMYESGLDNSVMYDNVKFNKKTHLMELADVGLMSFYVADCNALAELADILGREEIAEVQARGAKYGAKLKKLWNEKDGIYQNLHTDTNLRNKHLSPTLFYPMLAKVATQHEVDRMLKEHMTNKKEFWGEWVITMTPWNDPAYKDNTYWRGRIWAPVNLLVYLGLRNYNCPEIRHEFSEKSKKLLLKEWRQYGHIHENYSPISGRGCDVTNSDRFYHWGALLGIIPLIEDNVAQPF
jgi:glycogen debranching enzyme